MTTETTAHESKPSGLQGYYGYLSNCLPVTPGPSERDAYPATGDEFSEVGRLAAHLSSLQLGKTLDGERGFVRKLSHLQTLAPEILWHIFGMTEYRECWKLVFVSKELRERVLEYLEWVMRQKMRTGQWRIALDTKSYEIERGFNLYFSDFPIFNRRTLDLCVTLECTDMIADVWLPKPTTYEVIIRLVLCVSPVMHQVRVQMGTYMERYLGEGIAVNFFDGILGELNTNKWSKASETAVWLGPRKIATAIYNQWCWSTCACAPDRGGLEVVALRFVTPVLLRELDRI